MAFREDYNSNEEEIKKEETILYVIGAGLVAAAVGVYFLSRNAGGEEPVKKKRGDKLTISTVIFNSLDGVSKKYGVGCSIRDANGRVFDVWDSQITPAPGNNIDSRQINAGQEITHVFTPTLPTLANGRMFVRISVWEEDKLPVQNRLADTDWVTAGNIIFASSNPGIQIKSISFN